MAVGEWDERQLCPDGSCVGVIGPEGTCKVCGRVAPNWGDERTRGLIPEDSADSASDDDDADDDDDDWDDDELDDGDEADDDDDDDDSGDDAADPTDSIAAASASIPGWSSRQLCPDGACIGVIGPDGRCKVCGKRAADAPAGAPDSTHSADSATAASGDAVAAVEAGEPSPAGAAKEEPA